MDDPSRNPWTTLKTTPQYENPWIQVDEHAVLNPRGKPGIYGTIHYKHLALGILPVDSAGRVTLVGQYRYALGRYSWEVPEGGGPLTVDPLASAQRELRQETGLAAASWRELLRLDLSNSTSDEQAIGFLAWDLTEGAAAPDETEELRLHRVPFGEAAALVRGGEITDAISVALILTARLMAGEGALPDPLAQAMLAADRPR